METARRSYWVIGTVPAIKPAAAMSKTRTIGVLGTNATIVQPYVDRLAAEFAADCTVIRHGSAELVDLAEATLRGETTPLDGYRRALAGLLDQPGGERIDTIVLACTHFPLLAEELRAAFPNVTYVDGGPGIARRIAYLTQDQPWPSEPSSGLIIYTGAEGRRPLMSALARFGIGDVETL